MSNRIDLILLGAPAQSSVWSLGEIVQAQPEPRGLSQTVNHHLKTTAADALLFWHSENGNPDPAQIQSALYSPGDLWHSGLQMGMSGLPRMIDHVSPTWMLNFDVPEQRVSSSWRLSLRTCLMKAEVIRRLGFIHPDFATLEGAGLELGHRYITRGAIPRYLPWIHPQDVRSQKAKLPIEDEILFLRLRYGLFWTQWALFRAVVSAEIGLSEFLRGWKQARKISPTTEPAPLARPPSDEMSRKVKEARVTVLIPTLERYPYLRNLLVQLRKQTLKPLEIIVVDQTAKERRDHSLQNDFSDLPLKAIYLDSPGQCSSRNVGLQRATGDYILLLDDDVEVEPNLIESHVQCLLEFSADTSSGVIHELGGGKLPEDFRLFRVSDVFPAGNSLIPRSVLLESGLFDLAYERGQRADGDLGMRIHQTGALMVLNPNISVLHHRAPRGGLREHKARVITYASSRQKLMHRHLPSNTEIYLARRYFSPKQVREMLWIRSLGTFAIQGSKARKLLKCVISFLYLPHTLFRVYQTYQESSKMLQRYPQVPALSQSVPIRGTL